MGVADKGDGGSPKDLYGRIPVIPGYTLGMKTAISIPDDTFERATRRARELGLSRSELFARAVGSYLDTLDATSITHQINTALDEQPATTSDSSAEEAVAMGRNVLAASDW